MSMVSKKLLMLPCNFIKLMLQLYLIRIKARIAQLVEQWIEDPRVTSSNLVLGILTFEGLMLRIIIDSYIFRQIITIMYIKIRFFT